MTDLKTRLKEKKTMSMSVHQIRFMAEQVGKYIKSCEKKDHPVSQEVQKLHDTLIENC